MGDGETMDGFSGVASSALGTCDKNTAAEFENVLLDFAIKKVITSWILNKEWKLPSTVGSSRDESRSREKVERVLFYFLTDVSPTTEVQ